MRLFQIVFLVTIFSSSFLFSCDDKIEEIDPFPDRTLEVEVTVEEQDDFTCAALSPLDGELIPHWELICDNTVFINGIGCEDYALWVINDIGALNGRLGSEYESSQCNVDFESEMIIGVCSRRYCSEPLEKCDAKRVNGDDIYRFLQGYTCQGNQGGQSSRNYFAVVPKTGRDITVEIHRYQAEQEE